MRLEATTGTWHGQQQQQGRQVGQDALLHAGRLIKVAMHNDRIKQNASGLLLTRIA
jgi:hypothetical protein